MLRVEAAGVPAFGMADVVSVVDSTLADSTGRWTVDTLFFHFAADGDVYQFGFVAGVVSLLEGEHIAPAWDRIAAFSAGTGISVDRWHG